MSHTLMETAISAGGIADALIIGKVLQQ